MKSPFFRLRSLLVPCLGLLLISYFVYHTFHGQRGFFSYVELKGDLTEAEARLEDLAAKREKLEQRVALMHPHNPDPDMLDEQIRRNLGYAQGRDIIILKNGDSY